MRREELLSSIRLRLPIENVSLEGDLEGLDFNGVILSRVRFVDCSLTKVRFAGAGDMCGRLRGPNLAFASVKKWM